MAKKGEFITLKEAAELSGYSADYVGQLIRQGKLPGKQVFSNVAWVTTESAIREYVAHKAVTSTTKYGAFKYLNEWYTQPEKMASLARLVLWILIIVGSVVIVGLLFVVAIGIDQRLEERALKTADYE